MARRASLSLGITLLMAAVWLANRPPRGPCAALDASESGSHAFPALKVIARPWFGPHHVYGIFVVPDQYARASYAETVKVRNYEETLSRSRFPRPQQVENIVAPRGHYVKRSYVSTRVALWFLVTGRFGDLRRTCNWTLVFTERTPRAPTN